MMFERPVRAAIRGTGQVDEQFDAWTHVTNLMYELEGMLLVIKEAAIPVLKDGEPDQAWRTRRFLRLADRMLEDLHALHFTSEGPNGA
jgi:hypothetical protein